MRRGRGAARRASIWISSLDGFGRQLDRVTAGGMTALLVIGSAIVMIVREGPSFLGIPVLPTLGLAGYLIAFFNSVWIIYGIWRSGRE